ncbi:MAG: murein L,D-transpeptidase, partial [Thermomicrobiaceae bacterium]|nr:murein L,D-transpeptidase [Thermomicrobiaceae bacterium]
MGRRFLVLGLALVLALAAFPLASQTTRAASPPFQELASEVYFSQTGHHVSGAFLRFWWFRGGLDTFGFPLTEQLTENGLTVQYFERARFEYHPENPDNFKVLLGLVGREVTRGRTDRAFT